MINADAPAEMDSFVDEIGKYNNLITSDTTTDSKRVVEYICGEGDDPYVKYRLTLEPISEHSGAEFDSLKRAHAA